MQQKMWINISGGALLALAKALLEGVRPRARPIQQCMACVANVLQQLLPATLKAKVGEPTRRAESAGVVADCAPSWSQKLEPDFRW